MKSNKEAYRSTTFVSRMTSIIFSRNSSPCDFSPQIMKIFSTRKENIIMTEMKTEIAGIHE